MLLHPVTLSLESWHVTDAAPATGGCRELPSGVCRQPPTCWLLQGPCGRGGPAGTIFCEVEHGLLLGSCSLWEWPSLKPRALGERSRASWPGPAQSAPRTRPPPPYLSPHSHH